MKSSIIVVCYAHPELFPPTLNAINQLSKIYKTVYVYGLNNASTKWRYPKNVELRLQGNDLSPEEMMKWNPLKKWWFYLRWAFGLKKLLRNQNIKNIVFYDTFPFFALYLIRVLHRNYFVWYHNHDILDRKFVTPFSPAWASAKVEDKQMNRLSLFTLPSIDRLKYFSFKSSKVPFVFLPNYPAKKFYHSFRKKLCIDNDIKLIYQGAVDEKHGLEEIISVLPIAVNNKKLTLTIVGKITEDYKQKLMLQAEKLSVQAQVHILGQVAYNKLPTITAQHHIGIAIYKPTKNHIQFETVGTASNKIYEYAALGLPVLLFDNHYFKNKLGNYSWTFFTNLEKENLLQQITAIVANYHLLSQQSQNNFDEKLNYEYYFKKVKEILVNVSY